jgi:hypothetical protein
VGDVLEALRKSFDVRWQADAPLSKPVTGAYEGSLNRILVRVLDGYNFVLKPRPGGGVEVRILGLRGAQAVAGGPPSTNTPAVAAPTTAVEVKSDPPKTPSQPSAAPAPPLNKLTASEPGAPASMKVAEARVPNASSANGKDDKAALPVPQNAPEAPGLFPNAQSAGATPAPPAPEKGSAPLPFPDPSAVKMSNMTAPLPSPGGDTGTLVLPTPAPPSDPTPSREAQPSVRQ